jgi:hypothetical protein
MVKYDLTVLYPTQDGTASFRGGPHSHVEVEVEEVTQMSELLQPLSHSLGSP